MATLGQEMKNLRSELQRHRVNAVEGNFRTVDPNQKGRQNATRFYNTINENNTNMEKSKLVCTPDDIENIRRNMKEKLQKMDIIDLCTRERANTK